MFKKIKNYFLFFSILLLFNANNVRAIVCEYPGIGLNITYNHSDNSFELDYGNIDVNQGYSNFLLFKYGQSAYSTDEMSINQELFKKYEGYACPTGMYVCEYYHSSLDLPSLKNLGYTVANIFTGFFNEQSYALLSINEKKLYIITDQEYKDLKLSRYEGGLLSDSLDEAGMDAYEWAQDNGWNGFFSGVAYAGAGLFSAIPDTLWGEGIELLYYKEAVCNVAEYNGPYIPININCTQLTQKIYEHRDSVNKYRDCGEDSSCKATTINEMNDVEDGIKSYCSNILQNYSYVDGQAGCIDTCLTIKETLNSFKKGTDLYDGDSNLGECGFSARLLVWTSNILRWIKYILPVAVIIFGILDFIKAIGADKDDEMKKAQKRFIIRLIAAALVFIIPLILEFVLDKMGFGYDSCGLF